jgi:hypothetical protein
MRKAIQILLTIIGLLFTYDSSGQDAELFFQEIEKRLNRYCSIIPWEEVFIHTDRNEYIAGEDLWFSAYLVDRQSGKPTSHSSILYFDILNPDNSSVARRKVLMTKGYGSGHVVLPDTLTSGTYRIRAYTNWMKNFMTANSFEKRITIFNAISNSVFTLKEQYKSQTLKKDSTVILNKNISISENRDGKRVISFRADVGGNCFLIIQSDGRIVFRKSVKVNQSDLNEIELVENSLPAGMNQVVIFTANRNILSEGYFFVRPQNESEKSGFNIQERAKIRSEVEMKVNPPDENTESFGNGSYSISVSAGKEAMNEPGISEYLLLGTQFGINANSLKPDELRDQEFRVYDSLATVITSRWIDWNLILSNRLPEFEYSPETDSHFIQGRLKSRSSGRQVAGRKVILSIPGREPIFRYSISDTLGKFTFSLPVSDDLQEIVVQPEKPDIDLMIEMLSSFYDVQANSVTGTESKDEPSDLLNEMAVNYQVSKIYGVEQSESAGKRIPLPVSKRFYGKPDIELLLDDYIKLPVMQEVFQELMPGILLRSKKSGYEILIVDPVEKKVYEEPPGLFVDGVFITDAGIIADLDPESVEKIDAVVDQYMVGDHLFRGIINIITRSGDFSGFPLPSGVLRLKYRVIDLEEKFLVPHYSSDQEKSSRIPDLRNTLWWNPAIKPDVTGRISSRFTTSDFISDYVITIQGLSSSGKLLDIKRSISVVSIKE